MTALVRTVRSGAVGLDLALGGGFRFVRRTHLGDRESATLLIRGGPGTGKSVLAQDLALRLAAELGGDALYVCIEVLPSEVMAQRMGFEGFDPSRVVDLSREGQRPPTAEGPHLALGLRDLPEDGQGVPDLGDTLLDLARVSTGRGFAPKVLVVDSLSDGYDLGKSVPRETVDGICKLAIEQGWALILVEEVADDSISPWAFAVDTVLSLRIAPAPNSNLVRRELLVSKHRFGSCEPGPHRLQIEPGRLRVIPPFDAYRNAVRDLVLPSPSRDRSLQVPTVGAPPDPQQLRVPDGEGYCLVLEGEAERTYLDNLSAGIGRLSASGKKSDGSLVTLALGDESTSHIRIYDDGFSVHTLHQLIDGEEWLENALSHLSRWHSAITRVRVGPANVLAVYDSATSLRRALSLLLGVLTQKGFLVVLYGQNSGASECMKAAVVTAVWRVTSQATGDARTENVVVSMSPSPAFTFVPRLEE